MPRVPWPPKPRKPDTAGGVHRKIDGESSWVYLTRFPLDRTLRGQMWNTCCDCGLKHLFAFEVVRQKNGRWWLVSRAYRCVPDAKKRKKKKA